MRQLLTHTSGIPNFNSLEGFTDSWGKDELLRRVASLELRFKPGAESSYSNTGYLLLGLIIESVSGKSFGTFLRERIFEPLEMTAIRVNDPNESIRNRACGYIAEWNDIERTYSFSKLKAWHPRGTLASGCLVSTVADLVKWDAALSTEKLLKKSSLEQMWIPEVLASGETTDRGFGWIVGDHRGHGYIGHGGITSGFWGYMMRFVYDRLTVILLTNGQCPDDSRLPLVTGIARYYLPAPKPIEDNDLTTTEHLKRTLINLTGGHVDPTHFTPAALEALSPGLKLTHAFYDALGQLMSFQLINSTSDAQGQTRRYLATFDDTEWIQIFVLTKDGKIAFTGVEPT